jgi:glycosyltransferase involved in cell wall biosynthesis
MAERMKVVMVEAGVPFRPCGIRDYVEALCGNMPAGMARRCHVDVPDKGVTRDHLIAMMVARRQVMNGIKRFPPASLVHTHYNDFSWNGVRSFEDCYELFLKSCKLPQFVTLHEHPWFRNQHIWDHPRTLADHVFAFLAGQHPLPKSLPLDVLLRHRGIHVHQKWLKHTLCENGVPEKLITVIPHFVPACDSSGSETEAFKSRFGLSGKRLIVATGFVFERKCYERVLSLLTVLPADTVFCVLGGINGRGSELYLNKLNALAGQLGVSSRFVVTGYLAEPEMNAGMLAATLFVAPYGEVSASGSVARCIAAGAPIIAGECATFSELVSDGAGLLSVDAARPDKLLEGIKRGLGDPLFAANMRQKNSIYAHRNSVASVCRQILSWYTERLEVI